MIKSAIRWIIPHGMVEARRHRWREQQVATPPQVVDPRSSFHDDRHRRIQAIEGTAGDSRIGGDDYNQVLAFLVDRGLPEHHVREGSVPLKSLEFICERAVAELNNVHPLAGLHIGNFVGVSMAFLAQGLIKRHPESLLVSIDPNLAHRGITNPQNHVAALMTACGLQRNTCIIAGYSGRKSISNDGVVFDGYDPEQEFSNESACEDSLQHLSRLCPKSFDLVMLDGNHEATYLINEIRQVLPLLKQGGFVVLDDVDEYWAEIRDVFLMVSSLGLEAVCTDGRVGIARLAI